jgi:tetratricopeptide (TPR) repeat protein
MTEDLITDLSKLSGMFVIARNSVFTYKNKAVNIQQVAVDLGVRYVLEGSVRRVGGQIRINAQLIDANTGGHLWAERYDGKLDDIFALQDKITRKIVTALSVKLTPGEAKQRIVKYTKNARAYDEFLKGWNLGGFDSPEEFNIKVKHFKKAIELDPTYGHAHAALANIYSNIRKSERLEAVGVTISQAMLLALEHNDEALKYPTPLAHRVNSYLLSKRGKWDEAMAEAGLAIDLNPNDWTGYRAMTHLLINSGRPIEAKIYLNEAIRLNPRENYSWYLASILFHLEQYEEAIEVLLAEINTNPDDEWYYLLLAASYGHLERESEGKAAIQKFDDLRKDKGIDYSYGTSELSYWNFKDEATRERIREGLRKAGMMESIEY